MVRWPDQPLLVLLDPREALGPDNGREDAGTEQH